LVQVSIKINGIMVEKGGHDTAAKFKHSNLVTLQAAKQWPPSSCSILKARPAD
jgi:hypothetical protein